MKLSECTKNYTKQRVIMYNRDQTKALYKNRLLSCVNGCIYVGEPVYDNYRNELFDVFAKFPGLPALWLNTFSGRCEINGMEQWDVIKDMASLDAFVEYMKRKIEDKNHIRLTEILLLENIDKKLAEDAVAAKAAFEENLKRKHDERNRQDAEEAARRNAETMKEIEAAEQTIINGGELSNNPIIIYGKYTWERQSYTMIEYLMQKYGVEPKGRTKGWIRENLKRVEINDHAFTWHYQTSSKRKSSFDSAANSLSELIMKVRNK